MAPLALRLNWSGTTVSSRAQPAVGLQRHVPCCPAAMWRLKTATRSPAESASNHPESGRLPVSRDQPAVGVHLQVPALPVSKRPKNASLFEMAKSVVNCEVSRDQPVL